MGNTINVQGSYIDIHDNETVNLSVSGAEVNVDRAVVPTEKEPSEGKSEEEIARGIEALMPLFTVKSQWVAIYRVLVDFYGWPGELTAFCQRAEQLPFSHILVTIKPCRKRRMAFLPSIISIGKPFHSRIR